MTTAPCCSAGASSSGGVAGFFRSLFGGDEVARRTRAQREKLIAAEKKLHRAQRALEKVKARLASLDAEKKKLEDELDGLQKRLANARNAAERDRALEALRDIEGRLRVLGKERGTCLTDQMKARDELQKAEKEYQQAKKALEEAEKKVRAEIAARERAEEARRVALEEERAAQHALRTARKSLDRAEAEYQKAKKRRDKYQALYEEARTQADKCRRDVENAADERARARARRNLAKADAYAAEVRGKLEAATKALRAAERKRESARKALAEAEQRARAATEAVRRLKGETSPAASTAAARPSAPKPASAAAAKPAAGSAAKPKPEPTPKRAAKPGPEPAPKPVVRKPRPVKKAKKRTRTPEPVRPKPVLIPVKRTHVPEVSPPAPWAPAAEQEKPVLPAEQKLKTPGERAGQVQGNEKKIQFDIALVSGDKEIVERLKVWKEWADYIPFNPVSIQEINEFYGKLVKALQEEGYVFAKVTFPTRIWSTGIFLAKVDCGPLGTIVVRGNRHYSARQIIRALQRQEGERFNYARIYADLFDLNTKPDIKVDTRLKPTIQGGRRVINAELTVRDKLPIHGAFEASNTGTKDTNDWRFRTTLQHLNLTRHDDVLTLDWLTSPDWGDVNAYSGSYFLPIGEKYSVNVFGGYSKSNIDDVMPDLDVRGKGSFFGAQVTRTLRDTLKSRWQVSLGWMYRHIETRHDVGGMSLEDRKLDVSMPSITLGYASRTFDKLGGRNFFSNTVMFNFAGNFGASKSGEFNALGAGNADGSFVIDRFQIARLQHFFRGEETPGKWSLFMKLEGQLASDTLIPELRQFLGGANTVRGYEENDMAGDQALLATLELRTPLFQNFIPGLKKSDEFLAANPDAWQRHRLQFLLFADAGYVDMKEPLPGEQDSDTLLGVGAGLRLGLTKYSQMRLDIGYPLEKTEESDNLRAHLSLQLQF